MASTRSHGAPAFTVYIGDAEVAGLVANVITLTSRDALAVAMVDGNGDQITSFGGGVQYQEGDTDASITGTALMFEGAGDTLVAATGDASNGLDVDVTRVSGTVAVSNAGLTELAAAIDTELQVDVVGALPAGTNAIGKLAANSGVDIGDVDVTSSVNSDFEHGSNLDVDTGAEQLPSAAAKFGVIVKAARANTANIYVGKSDVTAGTTDATDGMELGPGESVMIPVNNANLIYVIAAANNQDVFWLAV